VLDPKEFYEALARADVTFYAGVPDSLLKDFCAYVTDATPPERNVITANEGGAVALAMGHWLATGQLGLVYLQNSGLGNTVNPLTSLADPAVYGVPMLLLVGWRGSPGEKDEPQHARMGLVTRETLAAIGVAHTVLPGDPAAAEAAIAAAVADAKDREAPHALVVKKGTFGEYKLKNRSADAYPMTREQAIVRVVERLGEGALVVSTTGMPSRELFETREARKESHETDLLTVGGMGHASQIALGVALQRPERPVWCLDGDGAVIMHMGGLATIAQLAPKNFKHVVLNNGAHDSVGGQPTVAFAIDVPAIARACGYPTAIRATTEEELDAGLAALAAAEGPALLEVRVRKGARKDLGRPTMSPQELKRAFAGAARRR
jgi:phosphonopyruvate decarboxylase